MCARHYRIRGKVQAKSQELLGDALALSRYRHTRVHDTLADLRFVAGRHALSGVLARTVANSTLSGR